MTNESLKITYFHNTTLGIHRPATSPAVTASLVAVACCFPCVCRSAPSSTFHRRTQMLASFLKEGSFLLAGGAFILRRVPAASATVARTLSTSSTNRCNEALSLEEAPFGQPLPHESESEEEEVMAAVAGGTVLFGQNKVRDWASSVSKTPTAASLGPARWIGSTCHSGDYTRASVKQPIVSSSETVWGQVRHPRLPSDCYRFSSCSDSVLHHYMVLFFCICERPDLLGSAFEKLLFAILTPGLIFSGSFGDPSVSVTSASFYHL